MRTLKKHLGDVVFVIAVAAPFELFKWILWDLWEANITYVGLAGIMFVIFYYRGIVVGCISSVLFLMLDYQLFERPLGISWKSPRSLSVLVFSFIILPIVAVCAEHWRRAHARAIADRDKLSEAAKYRDLLVGSLGHDLRTPLTAIMASAHLYGRISTEHPEIIRRIESSCRRMSNMIDQVMDMTAMHLGKGIHLRLTRVDLVEQAKRAIEETMSLYPDAHIQLQHIDSSITGIWDDTRIMRTLTNLLTNACKYGDITKPIIISLENRQEDVSFSVKNEGEPISRALLPMIFDPFKRGHTEASKIKGLGLGLYITAEMIDKHGGTITVQSTRETGTMFTVTLPRHFHDQAATPIMRRDDDPLA